MIWPYDNKLSIMKTINIGILSVVINRVYRLNTGTKPVIDGKNSTNILMKYFHKVPALTRFTWFS